MVYIYPVYHIYILIIGIIIKKNKRSRSRATLSAICPWNIIYCFIVLHLAFSGSLMSGYPRSYVCITEAKRFWHTPKKYIYIHIYSHMFYYDALYGQIALIESNDEVCEYNKRIYNWRLITFGKECSNEDRLVCVENREKLHFFGTIHTNFQRALKGQTYKWKF